MSQDQFYRAINKVERSLIRTDSDEVTYNLHVMLRFDLELDLLEGKLAVRDLPEAWRARFQSDIGVPVPDDKDGVLQDVHWYSGFDRRRVPGLHARQYSQRADLRGGGARAALDPRRDRGAATSPDCWVGCARISTSTAPSSRPPS